MWLTSRCLTLVAILTVCATGMASELSPWSLASLENSGDTWLTTSWMADQSAAIVIRANDGDCGGDKDCDDGCCDCVGTWRDNTEVFIGGDAVANIGDFPVGGFGNSFGIVSGFNTGFAIGNARVRGQFGASYGAYDFKGRGFGAEADSLEEQIFLTGGVYKRADLNGGESVSWALAYDGLVTDNWGANASEIEVGQVRYLAGWAFNECNEFGIWGTFNTTEDIATIAGRGTPTVRAMKQANAYWKHNSAFGADTMLYIGAMDNADVGDWVFGLTGRAPMSHSASLYGNFSYVTPSVNTGTVGDTEDTWNVAFGVVFFSGGKAVSPDVAGNEGLPLLPLANNSSLLVTD